MQDDWELTEKRANETHRRQVAAGDRAVVLSVCTLFRALTLGWFLVLFCFPLPECVWFFLVVVQHVPKQLCRALACGRAFGIQFCDPSGSMKHWIFEAVREVADDAVLRVWCMFCAMVKCCLQKRRFCS